MGDIIREIEGNGPMGQRIIEEFDIKEKNKRNLARHKLEDLVTKILEHDEKTSTLS